MFFICSAARGVTRKSIEKLAESVEIDSSNGSKAQHFLIKHEYSQSHFTVECGFWETAFYAGAGMLTGQIRVAFAPGD